MTADPLAEIHHLFEHGTNVLTPFRGKIVQNGMNVSALRDFRPSMGNLSTQVRVLQMKSDREHILGQSC